jgi:hypothetical protein
MTRLGTPFVNVRRWHFSEVAPADSMVRLRSEIGLPLRI